MDALAKIGTELVENKKRKLEDMGNKFLDEGKLDDILSSVTTSASALTSTPTSTSSTSSTTSEQKDANSNEYMCGQFQEMFKKNQQLYGEKVFESLRTYFQNEKTEAELTDMLKLYIGQYIRSSKFQAVTDTVIERIIQDVIGNSIKNGLKKKQMYKNICKSIKGGTKRKLRKKTIKRRN
jgi:hypothetical protein